MIDPGANMAGMEDDFEDRAERQLRDLEREEAALAAQEEGVRRKRDELQQKINKLELSLDVYREVMERQNGGAEPESTFFGPEIRDGTIAEMAEAVIRREGGVARVSDVVHVLLDRGKLTRNGRRGYSTVYSILFRDPRFKRVAQGTFALAGLPSARPSAVD